jgi:hypothetical protein
LRLNLNKSPTCATRSSTTPPGRNSSHDEHVILSRLDCFTMFTLFPLRIFQQYPVNGKSTDKAGNFISLSCFDYKVHDPEWHGTHLDRRNVVVLTRAIWRASEQHLGKPRWRQATSSTVSFDIIRLGHFVRSAMRR